MSRRKIVFRRGKTLLLFTHDPARTSSSRTFQKGPQNSPLEFQFCAIWEHWYINRKTSILPRLKRFQCLRFLVSLPVVRGRLGCIKRRRAKLSKTIWANLGRESMAFYSNQAEQTQNQQALTSMVGACLEVGSKTSSPGKSWFFVF